MRYINLLTLLTYFLTY